MEKRPPEIPNKSLSEAVSDSQQAIINTMQDVVKGAQSELTQAVAEGNEDGIKNAQEHVNQTQTQLAQAQTTAGHTTNQQLGE